MGGGATRSLIGSIVVVAIATMPSAASGSTVHTTINPVDGRLSIDYRTGAGEVSDLGIIRNIADESMPDSSATSIDLIEFDLLTIDAQPDCRPGFESATPTFAARCPVPSVGSPMPIIGRVPTIIVTFGRGDDRLRGYTADIGWGVDGGLGDDELRSADGRDNLLGGPGRDALRAGDGADGSHGGDGNDNIIDLHGDNQISGGLSSDTIQDGDGNSSITGDEVRSDRGGRREGDRIYDEGGNDRIFSGAGNDRIRARDGGADQINCGTGEDTAIIDHSDRRRTGDTCEHIILPRD